MLLSNTSRVCPTTEPPPWCYLSSNGGCRARSAKHLSCDCTADSMHSQHLEKCPCATQINQTSASEPLSRRRSECGVRTDSEDPLQQVITGPEDPLRKVISPQRPARTQYRPPRVPRADRKGKKKSAPLIVPRVDGHHLSLLIPCSQDESWSLSVPHVACHLRHTVSINPSRGSPQPPNLLHGLLCRPMEAAVRRQQSLSAALEV